MSKLPSNETIAEDSSNNTMDYMKTIDRNGGEISSLVHLFTDDDESPIMIMNLPPLDDDRADKMLKHMFVVPFISLLPVRAVSICQDTWFSKKPMEDEDGNEKEWVRPSQDIERKQGLITMVFRDDYSGIFNMREYGRDDNGQIYTVENTSQKISDWKTSRELQSWLAPLIVTGFDNKKEVITNEDSKKSNGEKFTEEDLLKSLFSGFQVLQDTGFQYMVREDMKDIIANHYSNISDTETYQKITEIMELTELDEDDE